MASYVIKTREVPATIGATALNGAVAVSVANTAGANRINFTPYVGAVGTLSYVTGSTIASGDTISMPGGVQINDIAFFFDGLSATADISGAPSAGWTLFDSAATAGIGTLKGYFKVMQSADDLTEVVTGQQTIPNSATYKTIGIFRPDVAIATLTLNLNPFVVQPPATLDKTLPMSSISSSAIGLIWYYNNINMSNTVCSGSFVGSGASISGSLPLFSVSNTAASTGYVRYKTYNKDESRLDLTGINLGSSTTLFTYFSAEII